MKRTIYFLFPLLLFAFVVLSVETKAQTIRGSIIGGAAARGSTARGVITMAIPGGLHVNSNRPSSEYAIPTTVRISGAGVRIGTVNFPRGSNRKFQFSESLLNVYEGRVSFPFTVKVPANFNGNTIRLGATVRYQACTNEVCYPPRTKEITITARVR